MTTHTLAFIFDSTLSKVLLIEKQRPDWQKGRHNGIGGKVEQDETSLDCVIREVHEETGLSTTNDDWIHMGKMHIENGIIDVYTMVYKQEFGAPQTTTDEKVGWYDVHNLPKTILDNLSWYIPLALYKLKHNTYKTFEIYYSEATS